MYVSLTRKEAIEVESLSAASIPVRKFIELNDSALQIFQGGEAYDSSMTKLIATVSYNGRIWDVHGIEISGRLSIV